MNVYRIIACIFAAAVCASLSSCASQPPRDVWSTEGWVSDDAYRIRAKGEPKAGSVQEVRRKGEARDSAVLNAQIALLDAFSQRAGEWNDVSNLRRDEDLSAGLGIAKIVRSGKVIAVVYGKNETCEIIYEISAPGLKKKVDALIER